MLAVGSSYLSGPLIIDGLGYLSGPLIIDGLGYLSGPLIIDGLGYLSAAPARNFAGLASGSTTPAVRQIGRLAVTAPQNGRISPWCGSIDP